MYHASLPALQMKNHEMAEAYCDEIWRRSLAGTGKAASTGQQQQQPRRRTSGGSSSSQQHPLGGRSAKEDADVYLALLNVYLKEDYDLNAPTPPRCGQPPPPPPPRHNEEGGGRESQGADRVCLVSWWAGG